MSLPLFVPVRTGLVETTLILYALPVSKLDGIVIEMVPLFRKDAKVPIVVGDEKLPVSSDN
jgi:hypothetical protein